MQDVEDYVAEKRDKKQGNRGEDRSKKFSAINLRPAERAEQTDYQQHSPNSKEQKVRPRKIARDWKSGEELIRKQPRAYDHDADPDRPIPFSFHRALAGGNRRIQRYRAIAIAAKARPPRITAAVWKPGPTSANGASLLENTMIAEITTPMMPSPTINPDASSTPSCFVASGFAVRSARLSNNHPATAPTTIIRVLCVGR